MTPTPEHALAATRAWVERLVIGLNLCPFAAGPTRKGLIRYCVSRASDPEALAAELRDEILRLDATDPHALSTTLLIAPYTLADFLDYNDFLDVADALLEALGVDGRIQIASFHPDYRFADAPADDVSHYTNRSPWPILHLLREDEIERAVASHPDIAAIPAANIGRMRALGEAQLRALLGACHAGAAR